MVDKQKQLQTAVARQYEVGIAKRHNEWLFLSTDHC